MIIPAITIPILLTVLILGIALWPVKVTDHASQMVYNMRRLFWVAGALLTALVWSLYFNFVI